MDERQIDLITISREFGAGGSELALALGSILGWPVLDHDLVQRVADRLRLDPRTVETMDEHPPRLLARLSSTLLMTWPESPILLDTSEILSPDAVADATRAAILEAAQSPPLIIVGHGTQSLFHDRPGTLHVRLVAPLDTRVKRICSREPCESATATVQVKRMDADRSAYVRRYHHIEWRDPLLYDIQINTGRVSIEVAAEMIADVVSSQEASRGDA